MDDVKYLFISILVFDGEMRHDHRVITMTRAKNIEFAAQNYVAHYYGYGERDHNDWSFHGGTIIARLVNYEEITKEEYYRLNELFV